MKTYTILPLLVVAACSGETGPTFVRGPDAGALAPEGGDSRAQERLRQLQGLAGAGGEPRAEDGGEEPPLSLLEPPEGDAGAPTNGDPPVVVDAGAEPEPEPLGLCEPCSSDSECADGSLCWVDSPHPAATETFCLPVVGDPLSGCVDRDDGLINTIPRGSGVWLCYPADCTLWRVANGGSR